MVPDASVLIAHLTATDRHHEAAVEILVDAGAHALLVHPLTLAEVLVGAVRVGRGVQLREDLRAAGVVVATTDVLEPLRLAELRVSTGLKLPDCCVLDVALQESAALATFDLALADHARALGLQVLP